jgi:cob(II)yrinic acid a,c-diamide reductase
LVTTQHAGIRRGVTVTAACSVSDNPATVLVCLNSTNSKNDVFEKSGNFALNSLGLQHRTLADGFAGFGDLDVDQRFLLGKWLVLETGAPVLADAMVSFDCRLIEIKSMSTHMILFGEVKAVRIGSAIQPLVYLNRQYHTV